MSVPTYSCVYTLSDSLGRLRASQANHAHPSRPRYPLTKGLATLTAIVRESSYVQLTPTWLAFWIKIPPLGPVYVIVAYFAFLMALQFTNNDVPGAQHYQALGIRAAWLTVAQLPLLILMIGKNNLVGLLSGVSYERLHIYHRWVGRGMLLMSTLHFGFASYGWQQFGLMVLEWQTDTCPPTGMPSYALLLALNLLSLAPLRNWSYALVVSLHLLFFIGFIVALAYHLIGLTNPAAIHYSTIFLYVSVGLYLFERLVRFARYVYNNIHPGYATLELLEGGATRLRVRSRNVRSWPAGSHMRLSIPWYGIFPSHPATILSTPTSHGGDLVFILRAHEGFTKRIYAAAAKYAFFRRSRAEKGRNKVSLALGYNSHNLALLDGPYGGSCADFASFDTLLLIAGSSGVTFTLSVLLSLAQRAHTDNENSSSRRLRLPLRIINFVWVVKKRACLSWIADDLRSVAGIMERVGIDFSVRIFVTCDGSMLQQPTMSSHAVDGSDVNPDAISPATSPGERTVVGLENQVADDQKDTPVLSNQLVPDDNLKVGRPNFHTLLRDVLDLAEGESAVAVCGPLDMSKSVRNTVVAISNERTMHKGTGAQGIYLHVENFC